MTRGRPRFEQAVSACLDALSALSGSAGRLDQQDAGWAMYLLSEVEAALHRPTTERPAALPELLASLQHVLRVERENLQEIMRIQSSEGFTQSICSMIADLRRGLTRPNLPHTIATTYGPAQIVDHVRVCMLLVSALLARYHLPVPASARTEAVRTLCSVIAARHPGQAIEIRIPPIAAIQVVSAGPQHTRGTPPNVVETDAATFLELAFGTLSWANATGSGALRASGSRAHEAAQLLPILRVA